LTNIRKIGTILTKIWINFSVLGLQLSIPGLNPEAKWPGFQDPEVETFSKAKD
jgi:hypothetical protein